MDPATMALIASVAGPLVSQIFGGGGGEGGYSQTSTKTRGQRKQQNTALRQWQELAGGGYENAIGLLTSMLDPDSETYKNFEAPYLQQFNQQIIPGIMEQFAGLDPMGSGLSSSGFAQSLGAAGANLQTSLASLKENLRQQGAQGILQQYNQAFGQTQGNQFALGPKDPSFGQSAMPGMFNQIGKAGANYLTNRAVASQDTGRGYQQQNPLLNQLDMMYRTTGNVF